MISNPGFAASFAEAMRQHRSGDAPGAVRTLGSIESTLSATDRHSAAAAEFLALFGLVLADADLPALARERLRAALQIAQAVVAPLAVARAVFGLGRIAFHANARQAASDHLRQARELYARAGSAEGEARCLLALAELYLRQQSLAPARACIDEALPLIATVDDDADLRCEVALLACDLGPADGDSAIRQALATANAAGNRIAIARAQMWLARQLAESAEGVTGEAIAMLAWNELCQRSSPYCVEAGLDYATMLGNGRKDALAAQVLDDCLLRIDLRRGQLDLPARFHLMEQASFIAQMATTARVAAGDDQGAFEVSERGQGRAALDAMFDQQRKRQGGRRLQVVPGGRVVLASPCFDEVAGNLAQSGTHLVKYMYVGPHLLAWWITPEGGLLQWNATAAIEAIDDATAMLLAANVPAGSSAWSVSPRRAPWTALEAALRRVGEQAFCPALRENLDARRGRLVIVAHRGLFHLPWAAIPVADGSPLGERWEISVVPSAGALLQLDPRRDAEPPRFTIPLLGVGDCGVQRVRVPGPTGAGQALIDLTFGNLPGASAEIAQAIAAMGGTSLTGPAATQERVLAALPEAGIAHFATHGLWHPAGDTSLLVLGGAPPRNYLPQEALAALQLQPGIVVLSACQTGLGLPHPDSYTGLAQGFLMAGARCVLVSLWPVGDAATQSLMAAWYAALRAGASPAAALQAAQGACRRGGARDGYDWAGFQFWGRPFHPLHSSPTAPAFDGPVVCGSHLRVTGARTGSFLPLEPCKDWVQTPAEDMLIRIRD